MPIAATPLAVLLDMDGTVVDTEPVWLEVQQRLVTEAGGRWTHDIGVALVGSGLLDGARVLQEAGVPGTAEAIVDTMCEQVTAALHVGVHWRPGALELLHELHRSGARTALVTMSYRVLADAVVAAAGFPAFEVIVAGDEVERPKPDPECYLQAMRLLGVDAADAVAIEDSVPGVAAALASGAAVVAVPQLHEIAPRPGLTIWPTLAGRHVADLAAVRAGVPVQAVLP